MSIPEHLAREFPLDGIVLSTALGRWTIRLRDVRVSAENTVRVALLDLEGTPDYRLHVYVPGEMLVVTHAEGEIDWLINRLRVWLESPEPKGPEQDLLVWE